MQYFGGKTRIANDIAAVIKAGGTASVADVFCGGLSVSVAMTKAGLSVLQAVDGNEALINMYRAYREGWRPPTTVTEAEYRQLMAKKDPADPMTAFAGFGCSFSARFFEGYARNAAGQNYAEAAAKALAKKFDALGDGPVFECMDYRLFEPVHGVAVYCDPPYEGTKWFSGMPKWNAAEFWAIAAEWARVTDVYVSEYQAPSGWAPVWERNVKMQTRTGYAETKATATRTEKLFKII